MSSNTPIDERIALSHSPNQGTTGTAGQGQGAVQDVVQQYEAYLSVSSARSHAAVHRSALEAVREYPEDAELLTVCAVLAIDTYLHGYGESPVSVVLPGGGL